MKSPLTRVGLFLLTVALMAGATGCAKKPKNVTPLPAGRTAASAPGGEVPVGGGTSSGLLPGGNRLPTGNPVGGQDLTGGFASGTGLGSGIDEGLPLGLDPSDKIEDRGMFAADTIYFDYDKSNVRSEFSRNLQNVANHLKSNPADAVLVEGHCDERGTEEYNRALGERRALSIRERLLSLGVSSEQVTTISYGEEKPESIGSTEADFARNRRGVFVLLKTPGSTL